MLRASAIRIVQTYFTAIVTTFLVVTFIMKVFSFQLFAYISALPALILIACSFLGHFVTLDDDLPGEWSNPGGSRMVWYRSVLEVLMKGLLFAVVLMFVLY